MYSENSAFLNDWLQLKRPRTDQTEAASNGAPKAKRPRSLQTKTFEDNRSEESEIEQSLEEQRTNETNGITVETKISNHELTKSMLNNNMAQRLSGWSKDVEPLSGNPSTTADPYFLNPDVPEASNTRRDQGFWNFSATGLLSGANPETMSPLPGAVNTFAQNQTAFSNSTSNGERFDTSEPWFDSCQIAWHSVFDDVELSKAIYGNGTSF